MLLRPLRLKYMLTCRDSSTYIAAEFNSMGATRVRSGAQVEIQNGLVVPYRVHSSDLNCWISR